MYDSQDEWSTREDAPPPDPGADFYNALNALYRQYYGRDVTMDEFRAHQGNPGGLPAIETLLKQSQITPGGDVTQPGPDPTPDGNGGSTGGGGGSGSLIAPFTTPYNPATPNPLPTIGESVATIPGAPQFPNIPRFAGPTMEEAMAEPGYQFAIDQGNRNLNNWLSSRGTQNDSSAAKAFIDYGQSAAAQQYANVWGRAYNTYQTNLESQYLDPFAAAYQNWVTGTVGPTMTNFTTNANNVAHLNDVNWQDNWNKWLQDWNIFRDQRDSTWDKQFQAATA